MDEPGQPPRTPDEEPVIPGRQVRKQAMEKLRAARAPQESELDRLQREIDEVEAHRMPLMDHLKELYRRVLISMIAVALASTVGFFYAREVYSFLTAPFDAAMAGTPGGLSLVNSPFEGIFTYFKVALISGVLGASPIISYQAWQFIAPGLYGSEKRIVLPLSMASVGLFFIGGAFCYYAIFPYAFPFFINVLDVDVSISANGYLSAVLRMMLGFGACFQLPVGAFFFARIGLIDHKDMIGGFRYAVVVIFVLAAIITPPDPLTQSLLAIPMVALYVFGIVIAWATTTKVREEAETA